MMIKAFKDFFYINNFFKSKFLYVIFLLLIIATFLEMLAIGILLPLITIIFRGEINMAKNDFIFDFLPTGILKFDHDIKLLLLVLILGLFLIKTIVLIIISFVQTKFYENMRFKISNFFFRLYMLKPYEYFTDEKDSSKIIRNCTSLSVNFVNFLERLMMVFNDLFFFLGIFAILLLYETKITIFISLIIFLASLIFIKFTKKRIFRWGKILLELSSSLIKDIQEGLAGIIQIKLLGKTNFFLNKFSSKIKENSNKVAKITFVSSLPKIYIEFLMVLIILTTIFIMLYFKETNESIIGVLTLMAFVAFRIIPLSNRSILFANTVSSYAPGLEVLCNEIKKDNKIKNIKQKQNIPLNTVELKNVYFNYKNGKKIFEDISIKIKKNEVIGIVGDSGSGKSTFLNLVSGLIKPNSGQIVYNKNDNQIFDEDTYKISYVTQDILLNNDTIKNNIAFGVPEKEINEEKIYKAIEMSQLSKFINSLPNKLSTQINELGINFSGGQIQRIAIARAFYSECDFLIFDESTAALDQETEKLVLDLIYSLKDDKIIIIVSHKKENLYKCDKILKIENLKIRNIKLNE